MNILWSQNNKSSFTKTNQAKQDFKAGGHNLYKADQFVSFTSKDELESKRFLIWPLLFSLIANNPTLANPNKEVDFSKIPTLSEEIDNKKLTGTSIELTKTEENHNRGITYTFNSPYGEVTMSQKKLFFESDTKPFSAPKVSILKVKDTNVVVIETNNLPGYDQNTLKIDLSSANKPVIIVKGSKAEIIGSPTNDYVEIKSSGNTSFYNATPGEEEKDTVIVDSNGVGKITTNNSVNGANDVYFSPQVSGSTVLNSSTAINAGNNNNFKNIKYVLFPNPSTGNKIDNTDKAKITGNDNVARNVKTVLVNGSGNEIINPSEVKVDGDSRNNSLVVPFDSPKEEPVRSDQELPLPKNNRFSYTLQPGDFKDTGSFNNAALSKVKDIPTENSRIAGLNLNFSIEAQSGQNTILLIPREEIITPEEQNQARIDRSNEIATKVTPCIDATRQEMIDKGKYNGYKQEDYPHCWDLVK